MICSIERLADLFPNKGAEQGARRCSYQLTTALSDLRACEAADHSTQQCSYTLFLAGAVHAGS